MSDTAAGSKDLESLLDAHWVDVGALMHESDFSDPELRLMKLRVRNQYSSRRCFRGARDN